MALRRVAVVDQVEVTMLDVFAAVLVAFLVYFFVGYFVLVWLLETGTLKERDLPFTGTPVYVASFLQMVAWPYVLWKSNKG